jgi:Holliday junction DNA helicase RuvA
VIAKLRGKLDGSGDGWVIVDVGGVGYLVHVSAKTAARLGGAGTDVTLMIETHVREDHIHLFGFADSGERDAFRLLTSVQGVGNRVALSVLSVLDVASLMQALAAKDAKAITRADGVGPKLAGRIVNELKDKALPQALGSTAATGSAPAGAGAPTGDAADDAVSALVNLGYGRAEAFGAVAKGARSIGDGASVRQLITAGLKELSA